MSEAKRVPVREMRDGDELDVILLVREVEERQKRDGAPYVWMKLADKTGSVEGKVWDNVPALGPACVKGTALRVAGKYRTSDKYGDDITIAYLRAATETEIDWDALLEGPTRPLRELEAVWAALVRSIDNEPLGALVAEVMAQFYAQFRTAPAAKGVHQAYRHGLLEHTVQVAEFVHLIAPMADLNHDVALVGALLHDIGKVVVYNPDPLAIDYTSEYLTTGEIPWSWAIVRDAAVRLGVEDDRDVRHVLHVILSHHGRQEWGSPVTPATPEALLVHFMDNLSGRLGSMDRLKRARKPGEAFSGYDRALGGRVYFGEDD